MWAAFQWLIPVENFIDHCILHDCVIDSLDDSSITTATSSCTCSLVKLFSLSKNLRMYNVKLKTGLSPSADVHSISKPQKKSGTYAFKLLQNTEPVYRKLYCLSWSVLSSQSLTWVWTKSSGTRSCEIRWINVRPWIKIWSDRNLKTGRLDSLSVRWNYNTLVAALIHIFFFTKILLQFSGWRSHEYTAWLRNDCDTPNKSWPWVSSEWLKITRKYKNVKQTFRLLEESRKRNQSSERVVSQSQVTLFFPMKGTIDYDLEGFCIPLLKGIVLLLATTQLG